MSASSPRGPLVVPWSAAILAVGALLASLPARAEAPQIEDVEESLVRDPSYKVRVDAALILGKLHQERSVPALIAGARDGHPAVRAASVRALGLTAGPGARDAVMGALHDPTPTVRRMARDALRALGGIDDSTPAAPGEASIRRRAGRHLSFEVRPVGDPRNQADPVLRSHMHDFLVQQLRSLGNVEPPDGQANYAVGGVIKSLSVARGGADVEITCAVELVVMRVPGNALFLTTSGQGRVLKPRRQFRPQQQASMELEAVEVAVRGASEDLISQLPR